MSGPVRLAALTQPGRAIVLALIEAERTAAGKRRAVAESHDPATAPEARRATGERPAAA
jgi:hypothetical protein